MKRRPIWILVETPDKIKKVGRVVDCPQDIQIPKDLWKRPILYKEVPFYVCHLRISDSVGIDADAWDVADRLGADAMIIYCKDKSLFVIARKDSLLWAGHLIDLGENPQYQIPLDQCELIWESPHSLYIPPTNLEILIKADA
jgi:hypothetical protein